jgi:nicotinic acetylcholine receptor, invertebrate
MKDERNMIITTNCWLNQGWIDPKLQWDPKLYSDISMIHVPAEKVWKPDILLGKIKQKRK